MIQNLECLQGHSHWKYEDSVLKACCCFTFWFKLLPKSANQHILPSRLAQTTSLTDHNTSGWRTSHLTQQSAALERPRAQWQPLCSSPCTPRTSATTRSCVIFRSTQMAQMIEWWSSGDWSGTLLHSAAHMPCFFFSALEALTNNRAQQVRLIYGPNNNVYC